jgi:predicted permease
MAMNGMAGMIERMWLHLEESATTLLQFAVIPILKILVLCSFGYALASNKINILPAASRKLLSKLVFALFLPCLIFTQLGKAATVQAILEWWFIPVNVVLGAVLGCTLGYFVALLVRPPPQYFNFTVVMIGIGNIGNMPLVIIASICHDDTNPFNLDPTVCNTNGIAYISFGQWVGAVIVYTFVYHMLAPPPPVPDFDEKKPLVITVEDVVEETRVESLPQMTFDDSDDSLEAPLLHPRPTTPSALVKVRRKVLHVHTMLTNSSLLKNVFQPPVVASLLALVIGCVPTLKGLIFEDHSFFFFLSDSLSLLGGAMVPCIMLVLGGNLIGGAGDSELGFRTTVAIVFTRLLLVPPLGLAVVQSANKLGFLPEGDKLFQFVLLMQHSMPTSILAGAVASLRGHGAKEASAILFYEHILAVFSIAAWLILYINVLF